MKETFTNNTSFFLKTVYSLLLLCLIFYPPFVNAEGWERIIKGVYPYYGNSGGTCVTHDGGSISIGKNDSNMGVSFLTRLDAGGNLLWSKRLFTGKYTNVCSIIEIGTSGYIVQGEYIPSYDTVHYSNGGQSMSPTGIFVSILRLDAAGNPLWNKTYGIEEYRAYMENARIVQVEDGFVISSTYQKKFGLFKINFNGELQWSKLYGNFDNGYYSNRINHIIKDSEGNLIATGYSEGNGDADIVVFKLNRDGEIIWGTTFGNKVSPEFGNWVEETSDGYVVGSTGYVGLLKIDTNGNCLWAKDGVGASFAIRAGSSGNIYVAAGVGFWGNDGFIFHKLDPNGKIKWQTRLANGPGACYLNIDKEENILLAGAGAGGTYIVKTDSSGLTGCNSSFIRNIISRNFKIPSHDFNLIKNEFLIASRNHITSGSGNHTPEIVNPCCTMKPVIQSSEIICKGDSAYVTVTNGLNFKWNTGEVGDIVRFYADTTKSFWVDSKNSCTTLRDSITITPGRGPDIKYSITSNTICEGDSIILNYSSNGYSNYVANTRGWLNDIRELSNSSVILKPKESSVYSIRSTFAYRGPGCSNAITTQVIVMPKPQLPEILNVDSFLISTNSEGNKWFFNGSLIPEENKQYFLVREPGLYQVVTSLDGCESSSSKYNYKNVASGINNKDINPLIKVFPSTVMENLFIQMESAIPGDITIYITNVMGQVYFKTNEWIVDSEYHTQLNFNAPAGYYILTIRNGKYSFTQKFIKS